MVSNVPAIKTWGEGVGVSVWQVVRYVCPVVCWDGVQDILLFCEVCCRDAVDEEVKGGFLVAAAVFVG